MAVNRDKKDQLHDLLPRHLNTRNNTNWKALVDAIGETDQETANLIAEVRKQFFVKTASRPYLDRLAANNKIARPKFVGMDDPSFRQYIPVLSYQPKQVKLIIDQLLDIFFFKESTTAFMTSSNFSPFAMSNGWELEILVDEQNIDRIVFNSDEFTNIGAATANEIVGAINREAKYCYATAYYDSITKNTFIKLFTKTVGSKGSLRIIGGRANVAMRFNGFIGAAGNGSNTQWTVSKVGDETTFMYVGGTSPSLDQVQVDDVVIVDIPGNQGSFAIKEVDLFNNSIKFINLFSTIGTFTQASADEVKFIQPNKYVAYLNPRRAMAWETSPGQITVEMPTSPPVVKRSLKGSVHVNGAFSQMTSRDSSTSLTMADAFLFPESGSFLLEQLNELQYRVLTPDEDQTLSKKFNTRLNSKLQRYEYASRVALTTTGDIVDGVSQITNLASTVGIQIGQQVKVSGIPEYARVTSIAGSLVNLSFPATVTATGQTVKFLGNQLTGITPNLPAEASLNQLPLTSLSRTSNVVTGITSSNHGYQVGESIIIADSTGILASTEVGDTSATSNVITNMSSTSGVFPGMTVWGPDIPINAYVTSVTLTSVTISTNPINTTLGATINFSESLNTTGILTSASGNTFTFDLIGSDGTALITGTSRVERIGMSTSGSKVILTDAINGNVSRMVGSYAWDLAAPYVLSSNTASTADAVQAGKIVRLLNTSTNTMPDSGGYVIFNYGRQNQEGPVRYLYKPTSNTIAIDPSYTFKKTHPVGSPIVAISKKGPHTLRGKAAEYAPYITDPSEARFILQDLIRSVKSAGIFVDFLVRYPDQLYATLDVYRSGIDPG